MKKAKSFRLPNITLVQLEELAEQLGTTQTEIVVLAIDRMVQAERSRLQERGER